MSVGVAAAHSITGVVELDTRVPVVKGGKCHFVSDWCHFVDVQEGAVGNAHEGVGLLEGRQTQRKGAQSRPNVQRQLDDTF